MIFSIIWPFLGPINCHCSRTDTLTGVTVTDRACSCTLDSLCAIYQDISPPPDRFIFSTRHFQRSEVPLIVVVFLPKMVNIFSIFSDILSCSIDGRFEHRISGHYEWTEARENPMIKGTSNTLFAPPAYSHTTRGFCEARCNCINSLII